MTRGETAGSGAPGDRRAARPQTLPAAAWFLAALEVAIHLVSPKEYGFFTDELYFLACGEHLDFGYVDMPPLTAVQAWAARHLFGDSVTGIHLVPALMGAGLVVLVAALARELGGGRFAQGMAALCIVVAPFSHVFFSFLSMNAAEPLVWTGCALILARVLRTGGVRLWPWFGLLSGIGLLNKHTMFAFGLAVALALLVTRERRLMANRWFLLAGLIAFLVFLPNLIWEIRHHFPHLEQLANIRRNRRNVEFSLLEFLGQNVLGMQPLALPVWAGGLAWLLFGREGRRFRVLGFAWLATLGLLLATGGRFYYLFPASPILVAAGAAGLETRPLLTRYRWVGPAYLAALLLTGVLIAPILLPILPPETYIAYSKATGGHLSDWLWGSRGYTGEVTIVLGDNREALDRLFQKVEAAGEVAQPYSMASQHFTVFVCREPKGWTFAEIWPRLKKWD